MCHQPPFLIADFTQVKKRVKDLKDRSDDIKSRLALPLKKLWNPERELRAVRHHQSFCGFRERFPQFAEVIDFYENTVISMAALGLAFEAPPVLLQGDPGLGKTYFASELAKLLDLPFYEISLATSTSSFMLSGGNLQWSEGNIGFIASTLTESPVANPIILIDEVDKARVGPGYNPMNVFYGLLEPHSAKRFRDEALEVELDASRIIWIATGNYIENIPAPIQSRMRVFEIHQPDAAKMAPVVLSIYDSIRHSKPYGRLLDEAMNPDVIDVLAKRSPRSVRLAIEEAAFKAISEQRRGLRVSDLPSVKKEKHRVGFI